MKQYKNNSKSTSSIGHGFTEPRQQKKTSTDFIENYPCIVTSLIKLGVFNNPKEGMEALNCKIKSTTNMFKNANQK